MCQCPLPHLLAVHLRVMGKTILDSAPYDCFSVNEPVRLSDNLAVDATGRNLIGSPVILCSLGDDLDFLDVKPVEESFVFPDDPT